MQISDAQIPGMICGYARGIHGRADGRGALKALTVAEAARGQVWNRPKADARRIFQEIRARSQRLRATLAQTASTKPNGQAPCKNP